MRPLYLDSFAFSRFGVRLLATVFIGLALQTALAARAADESALLDIERKVTHGYATNDGVRIHYARLGEGPLVVMIHGFPDCWLTWRVQMDALAKDHEVVALDQRGYNLLFPIVPSFCNVFVTMIDTVVSKKNLSVGD